MAASARSSQTRATLLLGAALAATAALHILAKTSPKVFSLARRKEPLPQSEIFMINMAHGKTLRLVSWNERENSRFLTKVKRFRGRTLEWRGGLAFRT